MSQQAKRPKNMLNLVIPDGYEAEFRQHHHSAPNVGHKKASDVGQRSFAILADFVVETD